MFNPLETLVDYEVEAKDGSHFSELYGWREQDDLSMTERQFYVRMWEVAFAHGRAQGQVDGVAYKSERIGELTRENTDFKDQISDLQTEVDASHKAAAMRLSQLEEANAVVEQREGELRDAAVGLRRQRETIGELEKKVITLVDRNMKRLSYRAWHKVMTVADERMSKAHP
jgi:chromosome segregation ATPase